MVLTEKYYFHCHRDVNTRNNRIAKAFYLRTIHSEQAHPTGGPWATSGHDATSEWPNVLKCDMLRNM